MKKPKPPLPDLGDVLYVLPSVNGERHRCGNCRFLSALGRCSVLNASVGSPDICGYWLGREPATKKLAGFTLVLAGTACDNCMWFTALEDGIGSGTCAAVRGIGGFDPAQVEARGCCSRWRKV